MTFRDNAIVFPHGKHDKEARSSVQIRNPPRDLRLPGRNFILLHLNWRRQKEEESGWRTRVDSSDILNESYFPYLFVAVLLSFVFKF
jgi:hypothetical protein